MRLKAKKERKEVRTYTSQQKALWLDFDHSLQLIYSQSNIKVIINLKLERSRLENVPIKRKLTLGCYVKKLSL